MTEPDQTPELFADDETGEAARRAEDRYAGDEYASGVTHEVTVPPNDDVREAKDRDLGDPADVRVDPEVLRNGGPTRTPGMVTTTGGKAGPASVRRLSRPTGPGKRAPSTTGDATTGGAGTPAAGSTSDASAEAGQVGNFTDR